MTHNYISEKLIKEWELEKETKVNLEFILKKKVQESFLFFY